MILDEITLRKLNQLTLAVRRARVGTLKGERRSTRKGASLEFADYRVYSPGDDLRRVDWNVYARLDRPFLKLFEDEQELSVHIFVDTSASMDWGAGEQHKFRYAVRLAAALGAVTLFTGDRLTLSAASSGEGQRRFGPARGQPQLLPYFRALEGLAAGGQIDLSRSLSGLANRLGPPGLVIVISDLLSPDSGMAGLKALAGRGHEAAVIHLLSPDELETPLGGDLSLEDIESGSTVEISLDAAVRRQYQQRVDAWRTEIKRECQRYGLRYLPAQTGLPWDQYVFLELRAAGLLD